MKNKVGFVKNTFLLLVIYVLMSPFSLKAAHIVGGDFTYRWLGGNSYQFTLCVYRDALAGGAEFDGLSTPGSAEAYVVLFNGITNAFVSSTDIGAPSIDRDIDPPIDNPCLNTPSGIEIDEGCYTFNLTLPANGSGGHDPFTIVYGRCCRNAIIDNLNNPGVQGALYFADIPARAAGSPGNNSPVFTQPPPIFICEDAPFVFDHSATDADGDSLAYTLCTPNQALSDLEPALDGVPGGTLPTAADVPFNMFPPFVSVVWDDPPHNESNMFGAGVPLTVNPQTGFLRATPANNGTFVVGVCVEEWRDGVLLGSYMREFQYTVADCNIPIIDVASSGVDPSSGEEIYLTNCDDFTVDFTHSSIFNPPPAGTSLSYWWSFGDGTTSNLQNPTHTYADTGRYVVQTVAFKDNGSGITCYSDTVTRIVKIYPFLDVGFTANGACVNEPITFTDTSNAPFDVLNQWQWTFGDGTSSSLQNPTHAYTSPGNYTVTLRATTEEGCFDIAIETITINPEPSVSFTASTEICLNETVTFNNTSSIVSGNIASYFWEFGDGNTSTATSPTYNYSVPGNYTITLTATSDSGCVVSQTAPITVNPLPNVSISPDQIICPGTSATLSASGGTSYSWTPAASLSDPLIANPIASPTSPTNYTVVVTDANGCQSTASVLVDLFPEPVADAGPDTSVCLNVADATVFNDTTQLFGSGGVSYNWSPIDFLSDPTAANPVVAGVDSNTTYTLTTTDANGCVDQDTATVYVLDPSFDLIRFDFDSVCSGDTLIMEVYDQGPITNYSWTPPVFITDPTIREPGFFPPTSREYVLSVDNYCYQKTDTVNVDVLPRPIVDAGPIDSICVGDPPYTLNATPASLERYQWSSPTDNSFSDTTIPNPTVLPVSTSQYFFTGTDSFGTRGCASTDSTTIFVYPLPDLLLNTPPRFICQGDSLELGLTSRDAVRYSWQPDPTLINENQPNPTVFPQDTNRYYVTVFNAQGCASNDSVDVNVMLPVTAVATGDTSVCFGFSVQLGASGGYYYEWSPGELTNNPNQQNPFVTPNNTTDFQVVVSNDCFDDTASVNVEVLPLPDVDAGEDFTVVRDETGQLNGSGLGNVLWYTTPDQTLDGILGDPETLNPAVSPFDTTDYVLRVENPTTGCLNYDTVSVNVEVITLIALPTGFTPNSDGTNDVFQIVKTLNIDEILDFEVYDRWGEKLFRAEDEDDGWFGDFKGEPAAKAVYVWKVRARTKDNDVIERSGTITLVR